MKLNRGQEIQFEKKGLFYHTPLSNESSYTLHHEYKNRLPKLNGLVLWMQIACLGGCSGASYLDSILKWLYFIYQDSTEIRSRLYR